jgi:hypothetical protein
MKAVLLLAVLAAAACATAPPPAGAPAGAAGHVTYGGGDGSSCEARVLIHGAADGEAGVAAEYAWLKQKYPGHQVERQALGQCEQRPADVITIRTADGKELTVTFDISEFFGKGFDTKL